LSPNQIGKRQANFQKRCGLNVCFNNPNIVFEHHTESIDPILAPTQGRNTALPFRQQPGYIGASSKRFAANVGEGAMRSAWLDRRNDGVKNIQKLDVTSFVESQILALVLNQ